MFSSGAARGGHLRRRAFAHHRLQETRRRARELVDVVHAPAGGVRAERLGRQDGETHQPGETVAAAVQRAKKTSDAAAGFRTRDALREDENLNGEFDPRAAPLADRARRRGGAVVRLTGRVRAVGRRRVRRRGRHPDAHVRRRRDERMSPGRLRRGIEIEIEIGTETELAFGAFAFAFESRRDVFDGGEPAFERPSRPVQRGDERAKPRGGGGELVRRRRGASRQRLARRGRLANLERPPIRAALLARLARPHRGRGEPREALDERGERELGLETRSRLRSRGALGEGPRHERGQRREGSAARRRSRGRFAAQRVGVPGARAHGRARQQRAGFLRSGSRGIAVAQSKTSKRRLQNFQRDGFRLRRKIAKLAEAPTKRRGRAEAFGRVRVGLKREEPTEDGLDVHRHAAVVASRASAAPAGNVAHAPFQTLRRERRAKLATLRDSARRGPRAPPERRARRTPSQTVGDGVQERHGLRRLARLIPREPPRELVREGGEQLARHRLGIHRELENHREQPSVDEVKRRGFARVISPSRRRTPRVPPDHQQRRRVQKFRGGHLRRAIRRRQRQRRRAR